MKKNEGKGIKSTWLKEKRKYMEQNFHILSEKEVINHDKKGRKV